MRDPDTWIETDHHETSVMYIPLPQPGRPNSSRCDCDLKHGAASVLQDAAATARSRATSS